MPKQNRRDRIDRKAAKVHSAYQEKAVINNDWKLDWFIPSEAQEEIVYGMDRHDLTIVDGPSGTGKTSTAVWKALMDLKQGHYRKIVFIKNPTEAGDDMIGYLKGEVQDKLAVHFSEMKRIFLNFVSKGKLESDEGTRLEFTIPNYLLGTTFDDSIIIVDEGQTFSPNTMKLVLERAGEGSRVVVCGDSRQRYSVKKRDDGFSDLISKVTVQSEDGFIESNHELIHYVKLTTDENQRSELSKLITELYA